MFSNSKIRLLALIFFLSGCGGGSYIVNVSYDPIDYPPQFFSSKDKPPTLYIDSVVDNREFVVGGSVSPSENGNYITSEFIK